MTAHDPYELLGVPRDSNAERIRRAYDLAAARAHRDGAVRHLVDLSAAYDVLSDPARRSLYDRHGVTPLREQSPGAAPPPVPWRIAKDTSYPTPKRNARLPRRRRPLLAVFGLGMVAGLLVAAYLIGLGDRLTSPADAPGAAEQQVLCDTTPAGQGYIYSEPVGSIPSCTNGAVPQVLGP